MKLPNPAVIALVLAFILLSALFMAFPSIDLAVTGYFWRPDAGFFLGDWPPFVWLYVLFAKSSAPLAIGLLLYWATSKFVGSFMGWPATHLMRRYQQQALFMLLVFIIGTLLVEVVLKLGWGRARPRDIVAFGGDLQFTAAWIFSDQCHSNCSFMSGHASFGYYFMVLAWLKRSWLWLAPGIILGLLLGLTRIAQGGHFASDVLLPFFVVMGVSLWTSQWVLTRNARVV